MLKKWSNSELLAKEFKIKDLGNLKYSLGMEVARFKKDIFVSPRKYVLDLLKETGMWCKLVETPMDSIVRLGIKEDSVPVNKDCYKKLVRKFIHLSRTRSDIDSFVVIVNQFVKSSTKKHMKVVYRILRYLKMIHVNDYFSRKNLTEKLKFSQVSIGQVL